MPLARIKSSVWWNYSRYVTRYFNFNRCRPRLQNLSLDGDHTIRYNPDNFKRTNVFFFLQQILPMLFYSCKVFYLVILLIRKLTKFCSYRQPDMILDLYVNCTWWKAPFGITDRPDGPTKKRKRLYTCITEYHCHFYCFYCGLCLLDFACWVSWSFLLTSEVESFDYLTVSNVFFFFFLIYFLYPYCNFSVISSSCSDS